MSKCPETDNGEHYMEYVTRPASFHNGKQVSEAEKRGVCAWCDYRTTEGA